MNRVILVMFLNIINDLEGGNMGDKYLVVFFVSLILSMILTPLVRKFCYRIGLLDENHDGRKIHKKPIPRLGGIAFFLSFLITSLLSVLYCKLYSNPITDEINIFLLFLVALYIDTRRSMFCDEVKM